ncbi:MAG: efflux RND transporter periplasmic adaptor subunit [Desulfovibrionaceae bacterium]
MTTPSHLHRSIPMLALCLLLALTACGNGQEKQAAKTVKPVPITATMVVARDVPITLNAVGNVETQATVAVKPVVGGMIVEQQVRDGQDVKQGDLLFRIDPRPYVLAVSEAQAKLDQDRALLVKARGDLARYATLRKGNVVAQQQYDEAYSQASSLEGTVRLNEAMLARAKLDLEYATIRSPISGRVGSVLLTRGNVLKANDDRVMCVINQIEPIFVSFSVPEQYLGEIMTRNAAAPLTVDITPSGSATAVAAALAAVDNTVDTRTGTIRLRALYGNGDRRLWPGQFLRVSLRLSTLARAVLVPTQAILDGLNGPYVYVVTPESTAEARQVERGPIINGQSVVSKGLAPGETVVVDGHIRLAPGLKVEVRTPGGAAKASGKPANQTNGATPGEARKAAQ